MQYMWVSSLFNSGRYRMLNDINVGRELKSARIPESLIFNDKRLILMVTGKLVIRSEHQR